MDSQKTTLDNLVDAFIKKREKAPLLGKIGLVRSLIGAIDAAKNDGFGFGVILEALMKNGFKETKINQFYGLVNRSRIEAVSLNKEVFKENLPDTPAMPGKLGVSKSGHPKAPDVLGEGTPVEPESLPDETGKNSNRPPPLLSENKGVWGKLKPSPVDGTVDLKQK